MIVFAVTAGILGLGIFYVVIYLAVKHALDDSKLLGDLKSRLDKIEKRDL